VRRPGFGLAVVMSAACAMLALGSGVAQAGSAPNVTGQKYGDATSVISGAALRQVVSTTIGDQKAWPDWLVANERERTVAPPPNSAGSATTELLVALNCDSTAAWATLPGYSAASPEAKAIKAAAATPSG
jgi:hypothetical protein